MRNREKIIRNIAVGIIFVLSISMLCSCSVKNKSELVNMLPSITVNASSYLHTITGRVKMR